MRAFHRWTLVALAVAFVVLVPMAVRALPVHDEPMSAADLLSRIRSADDAAYAGTVDVHGRLGLPVSDHFTDIADLLGSDTRLRVWWRSAADWRVDRLLATGEIDLFHHGEATTRWDYERAEAQTGIDPAIRLPRSADLLPPALAHRVLNDAQPDELTRLPARRIAGHDALGLRLEPSDPHTSIDHVDLWADPHTGLVLAVDAFGTGTQPALSTSFSTVDLTRPAAGVTRFRAAPGVHRSVDDVLDIADAANQFAPVVPPASVAGLTRSASSQGAVGIYGAGLAQVMTLPLRPQDAGYLAEQLRDLRGTRRGGVSRCCGWVLSASTSCVPTRLSTSGGWSPARSPTTRLSRPATTWWRGRASADDPDQGSHQAVRRGACCRGSRPGRRRG